jgi:hypothetical protein
MLTAALASLCFGTAPTALAFNSGDVMTFDPGVLGCPSGGSPPNCDLGLSPVVVEGSYFAMDVDNNGMFEPFERTPIAPGPDGGIVIGVAQPATNSHFGCPDGSENARIDAPWCFFANTGMHQTATIPVTDNLNGTMDYIGWGVTWNGIPNIPLGGDPANFPGDTGLGILNCATNPCQPGEPYTLDYTAHVPLGDPSGFGGVFYGLHLELAGPTASVTISVPGGTTQECTATDGNRVSMTATPVAPNGDAVASIDWTVDGIPAGSGTTITVFMGLGAHSVEVDVITSNGLTTSDSETVTVEDTTAPLIKSAFMDPRNGNVITTVSRSGPIEIAARATDLCDPAPTVSAVVGAPVDDKQGLKVAKNAGKVSINTPNLTLSVKAKDKSGNASSADTVLTTKGN